MKPPLEGIRVLDFSTLLPGPMATLVLAEAGAEVIKIERPERGDEMRSYVPKFGEDSANFALLNRGKRSVAIDLKAPDAVGRLRPLVDSADVLVEQFRPGVMDRLGLGYEALSQTNPGLVYCSITGHGQSGPRAGEAGHDLNYMAETGMLALAGDREGTPVVPGVLTADLAGGTYPAVVNILLALHARVQTGRGRRLDISMCDNLFPLMYWALGNGFAAGAWPRPGGELVTGGSPRYQIYRTKDGGFIAAAPLEEKFWQNFCEIIGLDVGLRDDGRDPAATIAAVQRIIASATAAKWAAAFAGRDACCNVVQGLEDAVNDPHFRDRGLFAHALSAGGESIPALPMPLDPSLRRPSGESFGYPALGADNRLLEADDHGDTP